MTKRQVASFRALSITNEPLVEVANDVCAKVWEAAAVIGSVFRIEEVYGYVIESWLSFEDEVAFHKRRALQWMNAKTTKRTLFYEARANIDLRLLSFMSATRMYLDQSRTRGSAIPGVTDSFRQQLQQVRNQHRRSDPFFLVADEFRNLMQHENLGLDRIRSGWESRATESDPAAWTATLLPELLSIKGIHKAIESKRKNAARDAEHGKNVNQATKRREQHDAELLILRDIPTPINVQLYMRRFCAALSDIHVSLRLGLQPLEEHSVALHHEVIANHGDSRFTEPGIRLQRIGEHGTATEEVWVGLTLIERLKFLRERYTGWERVRTLSE